MYCSPELDEAPAQVGILATALIDTGAERAIAIRRGPLIRTVGTAAVVRMSVLTDACEDLPK